MVPWIQQYLAIEELLGQRSPIDPSVRADLLGELHFHYAARRNPLAREKSNCERLWAQVPEVDCHEGDSISTLIQPLFQYW